MISLIVNCYLQIKLIPPPPDSDKKDSTKDAEGDLSDKDGEKQAKGENSEEEEEKKSENIAEDKEDEDEKKGDERDEQDKDKDSKDETEKNKENDDPMEENTPKEYFFLLNDWVKVTEDVDCWREIPVTMDTPEDMLPGKSHGDLVWYWQYNN